MGAVKDNAKKNDWKEKSQEKESFAREQIESMARGFQERPETIAEYLEFGSRFYKYSVKNTMLIYSQNPAATYVQSFKAWKDTHYSVKKGEQGLMVRVPVKSTFLKIGEHKYIQLRDATQEQREAFHNGSITGYTQTHFKIGTVFDISQTNYPREKYPELFQMGYDSSLHKTLCHALMDYASDNLNCPTTITDLQSISLRGFYSPTANEIHLNHLLKDTEQLSTMAHELGHAMIHNELMDTKNRSQIEYEGDCLAILLTSKLGLEITDGRKRHLADHFRAFETELKNKYELDSSEEKDNTFIQKEIESSFSNVFQRFQEEYPKMQLHIEKHTEQTHEKKLQKQTFKKSYSDSYFQKYSSKALIEPISEHDLSR